MLVLLDLCTAAYVGRVAQAVAAASKGNFSLQAVHSQYSDAGLLAVKVSTSAANAGATVSAAAAAIQTVLGSVTDAEVAKAKYVPSLSPLYIIVLL